MLRRRAARDRRERQRDARLGAGATARPAHPPAQVCLPGLRDGRAGAGAGAADRQGAGDARRCWPRCWSASTATTRRSTGSRRSSPARASSSTARRWRMGRRRLLVAEAAARAAGGACVRLGKLFADDTPVPVLDPGRGRTKTGRLWVYARETGRGADPSRRPPSTSTAPDRKAERPAAHLAGSAACCRSTAMPGSSG